MDGLDGLVFIAAGVSFLWFLWYNMHSKDGSFSVLWGVLFLWG